MIVNAPVPTTVIDFLRENNFQLIHPNYLTQCRTMQLKCSKGHTFKKTITALRRKPKCPVCAAFKKEFQLRALRKQFPLIKRGNCFFATYLQDVAATRPLTQAELSYWAHKIRALLRRQFTAFKAHSTARKKPELMDFMKKPNYSYWAKDRHGIKWCIDHKFPLKAFIDHGIFDHRLVNHLDNLEITTRLRNSHKRCNYDRAAFLLFLAKIGATIPERAKESKREKKSLI